MDGRRATAVAPKSFRYQEEGKTKVQTRFIKGKQSELCGKAIKGGIPFGNEE
jgi:hypothetical protein